MRKNELEELYNKYYNSLMVIACSYTHNQSDAQDLVQNTFVKAYLSYKPTGSFLYWCNRVLRNEFYNMIKKQKYIVSENVDLTKIKGQDDLLSNYIDKEERSKLAAMISLLPLKYRDIMIDCIYLQQSDKEIGEERGLSPANVRKIKSRGKAMLIKIKEEEENEGHR